MSPRGVVVERALDFVHAVRVARRVHGARDAAAGKEILDLADGDDRRARVCQQVEQRRRERRQREVAPVGGSLERARRPDKRPRDHAADSPADAHQVERDCADAIQLRHRHDVLVRGNLEDAVGRRVDDRRSGAHVLGPELVDDRGARGRLVPERVAPDALLEWRHHVRRKAVRKDRKRTIEDEPHQLPVPGHRVLARRRFGHPSERRARRRLGLNAVDKRQSSQSETAESREAKWNLPRDVAERVAALVAVGGRVGQLADADAIEHDEDDAGGGGHQNAEVRC